MAGRYFHGIERVGNCQLRTAPGDALRASATLCVPPSDLMSSLDMTALSQIVGNCASPKSNSLCVADRNPTWHFVDVPDSETFDDKNGGPNNLRAWRMHRKLSQAALAERVGTTANMIQYLESGERALSLKWLRRLAPVLETTVGMLADHAPENVDAELHDFWTRKLDKEQRQQFLRIADALTKTGTDNS